jgi:predicted Zn-dependent protease
VTISAPENDPRILLVREAVDFWNQQLTEIGAPFQLGVVNRTTETVPSDYLKSVIEAREKGERLPDLHDSVRRISGDIIVALSDGDFSSFTISEPLLQRRVLIGIRSHKPRPLSLPNVARNVIAHELGHAIGLGHNDDPTKLMCGRPEPCRPDAFQSHVERFFPLTEEEKAMLRKTYSPS